MRVLIDHPSPRAEYVIQHVLSNMLGMSVEFVLHVEDLLATDGPKLWYGGTALNGVLHIPDSGGLRLDRVPQVSDHHGGPWLFEVNGRHDVFASIFYLLSLVDELRCTDRDAHGRVPSEVLFAVRTGLADAPWVDRWALALAQDIEKRWPGATQRRSHYRHVATVDMDSVSRFRGRSLPRALGATVKELLRGAFGEAIDRWAVRSGLREDPYLAAMEVVGEQRQALADALFFFLMRGHTAHDHAAAQDHPDFRRSVARAARYGAVGLHPSYATSTSPGLIARERDQLEAILGAKVRASRQHFLRWQVPETLRELEALGFVEDHTLGFADRVGFRAGTCTPFAWYDLEQERVSGLMLHPFAAMDSALIDRMRLGPEAVVERMCAQADLVRAVDGTFVSVWHDRYLSGYRGSAPWPSVFRQVAQHAKP